MRIIGGAHRGRTLSAPRGPATRPTSDMVREALFSTLFNVEDWRVLDLFAGTGAVGCEALSRGAGHVVFVEKARPALACLQDNLSAIRATPASYTLHRQAVASVLTRLSADPGEGFDLIFADPPYDQAQTLLGPVLHGAAALLAPDGQLICEHRSSDPAPIAPAGLVHLKSRRYGEATLSFYEAAELAPDEGTHPPG